MLLSFKKMDNNYDDQIPILAFNRKHCQQNRIIPDLWSWLNNVPPHKKNYVKSHNVPDSHQLFQNVMRILGLHILVNVTAGQQETYCTVYGTYLSVQTICIKLQKWNEQGIA